MGTDVQKAEHKSIFSFRGLLGDETRLTRQVAFVVLAIVSASLTFTQLGFFGIGSNGSYLCYVSTLLFPIVLSALLLGRGWGILMGAIAGIVLVGHANFQPLDIFELYFVNNWFSVFTFTFVGLMASVFLSVALRNGVRGVRTIVYMGLACALLSFIYAFMAFVDKLIAVTLQTASRYYETGLALDDIKVPPDSIQAVAGTGNPRLETLIEFLTMFVLCVAVAFIVERYKQRSGAHKLRTVFRVRLFVVVVLVFLVTSCVSFVINTSRAEMDAHDLMDNELGYLIGQVDARLRNDEALGQIQDEYDIPNEELSSVKESLAINNILDGYTYEYDGTLVLFHDNKVVSSNNSAFEPGNTVMELFGYDEAEFFGEICEQNLMKRTLYDDKKATVGNRAPTTTQIGYMCARKTDVGDYCIMMMLPASQVFSGRSETMAWMTLSAFILLTVVFLIASKLLTMIVVDEIDETNDGLGKITSGQLDELIDVRQTIEFASLSDGINTTVDALKGWIGEAERRMEADLATAKIIQESALPRTFPPFPEIDAFDLYASMDAAKEVGGDFYDFFLIDDHTLGFLVADVSGKGIPGALFMMAAKTEIGNYMNTGMSLSQAILSANHHLCKGNDAGMFVTVWAATLDWKTGELTYVNAGHNYPLLRHGLGGEWEWVKQRCGLFLGTFETAKYKQKTIRLSPGDALVVYTDGVNEAFNVEGEEYGNDRLEAFLANHADLRPRKLVEELRADVAEWADGTEQSDDVTIMCLTYGVAPEVTVCMEVQATVDHLGEVVDAIEDELYKRLCPVDVKHKIVIALEELFVNVCRYAYADQDEPGTVSVSYTYSPDPQAIYIEIVDQGVPFDPLSREDPTRPASIDTVTIGGLGIFIVKKSMDLFTYRRVNDSNMVTIGKSW